MDHSQDVIIHSGYVRSIVVTTSNGLSLAVSDDADIEFHVLCNASNRVLVSNSFRDGIKLVFEGNIYGMVDGAIQVSARSISIR